MDTIILTEKLESLRRCVQRIEEKQPRHIDELKQSIDLQDILVLNLTRAIQPCVDIGSHLLSQTNCPAPRTMGNVFTLLQEANIISPNHQPATKKAVGFRNIAIHQYEAINWGNCLRNQPTCSSGFLPIITGNQPLCRAVILPPKLR